MGDSHCAILVKSANKDCWFIPDGTFCEIVAEAYKYSDSLSDYIFRVYGTVFDMMISGM